MHFFSALAIEWGPVGDVGIVIDVFGSNDVTLEGTIPQSISSCLIQMDHFLNQTEPIVTSFCVADKEKVNVETDISAHNMVKEIAHVLGMFIFNYLIC